MRRLAFLSSYGRGWVAATVYLHNLVRALASLPEAERPRVDLLLGPDAERCLHVELKDLLPSLYHYVGEPGRSLLRRPRALARSLLAGRWPRTLSAVAAGLRPDVVFPALGSLGRDFPAPWIAWVPDLQHKRLPHFFSPGDHAQRDMRLREIEQDAAHVVVSSQDACADLWRYLPGLAPRTSVLSFVTVPSSDWYECDPALVARGLGAPDKYLLFPSQFWAHKNHLLLLDAIRRVRDEGGLKLSLVCTGHPTDYRAPQHFMTVKRFIAEHGLEDQVRILGFLDRWTQVQLMRRAVALVQPSLFEGWSALVEDARTLGKIVYVSDIPVHREQRPPRAEFFHPERPEQLAELLGRDWARFEPGPDEDVERVEREAQPTRTLSFARAFLSVVDRVRSGA